MEVLLAVIRESIWSSFAFLHTTLAPDTDFSATLPFHLLQTVTTWANKQAEEINLGEFLDRNVDFFLWTKGSLLLVVFNRGTEVGIGFEGAINEFDAFFFKPTTVAEFSGVCPTAVGIVCRRRGWGPKTMG